MIAVEVLFNDGPHELRYRIARGVATLLGTSRKDGERLFDSMRRLYDLRSNLVHTGAAKGLDIEQVWDLRDVVRQAIVQLTRLGWSKEQLSRDLTATGFGQQRVRRAT